MGPFLTSLVLELQRGHLYTIGVEFARKRLVLVLVSSLLLLRGSTDLSLAVGHVSKCPHSRTRYLDDIFMVVVGGTKTLDRLFEIHPNIKLTMHIHHLQPRKKPQ